VILYNKILHNKKNDGQARDVTNRPLCTDHIHLSGALLEMINSVPLYMTDVAEDRANMRYWGY